MWLRLLVALVALFSSYPVTAAVAIGSLSHVAPPPAGSVLYQLTRAQAINRSDAGDLSSIAIQTNITTGNFVVYLSDYESAVYSLPYPAFQPVGVHPSNLPQTECGAIYYVAVHPISQLVYFSAWDSQTGRIGHYQPDGTVSMYTPLSNTTHYQLLWECWALTFSLDGSWLYFGNYLLEEPWFTIVQFNVTDGSVVRWLLANEKDSGNALALTSDEQQYVYVVRSGTKESERTNATISVYSPTGLDKHVEVQFTLVDVNSQEDAVFASMAWHDDLLYVANGQVVHVLNGTLLRDQGVVQTVAVFSAHMEQPIHLAVMPDSTVVVVDIQEGLLFLQGLQVATSSSNSSSSSSSSSSSLSSSTSSLLLSSSSFLSSSSSPSRSSLTSSTTSSCSVSSFTAPSPASTSSSSSSSGCPVPSCPDATDGAAWSSSMEYALSVAGSLLIGLVVGLCIGLVLMPRWRRSKSRSKWSNAAAREERKRQRELAWSLMRQEQRVDTSASLVHVHE